ncbi:hypothetical protein [Thermus phage TSP4]|nr:hypothetical protein [Thermus phage TSP4]
MRVLLLAVLLLLSTFALTPSSKSYTKIPKFKVRVTATAYTSLAHLTDSTPFLTASMTRTRVEYRNGVQWHVVAVSRDLLTVFPYGSKVFLRCPNRLIYGLVEDTMHIRWRRRVDIWFPDLSQALRWGKKECILEGR